MSDAFNQNKKIRHNTLINNYVKLKKILSDSNVKLFLDGLHKDSGKENYLSLFERKLNTYLKKREDSIIFKDVKLMQAGGVKQRNAKRRRQDEEYEEEEVDEEINNLEIPGYGETSNASKFLALILMLSGAGVSVVILMNILDHYQSIASTMGYTVPCTTSAEQLFSLFSSVTGGMSCSERQTQFDSQINTIKLLTCGVVVREGYNIPKRFTNISRWIHSKLNYICEEKQPIIKDTNELSREIPVYTGSLLSRINPFNSLNYFRRSPVSNVDITSFDGNKSEYVGQEENKEEENKEEEKKEEENKEEENYSGGTIHKRNIKSKSRKMKSKSKSRKMKSKSRKMKY